MATKNKKHTEPTPEEKIEAAVGKTEQFFQTYGKQVIIGFVIAIVVVGGYFTYQNLYVAPRSEKAAEMMFVAEQNFAAEDYEMALNGDGNNAGFIEVVDNYKCTSSGRLAAHYAGVCYMKLGDLDSALDYLKKFKPAKGPIAVIVNAQNYGLRGDICVDKGDYAGALKMYKKAVACGDNVLSTPYFLKKQAMVLKQTGDISAALAACQRIKDQYGASLEARDIDKLIGELSQK